MTMSVHRPLLLALALILPTTAHALAPEAAAPVPPLPSEHRLSDAEVDLVLDAAAGKRELSERLGDQPGRQVHGEVGVSIGTGGYRSAFGTAVVPIAGEGAAILSFDFTDLGTQRRVVKPLRR